MEEENILDSELADETISIIVCKALKKYKIDKDRATDIVIDIMQKNRKFLNLLENKTPLKQILKSHSYDEVNHKSMQEIYYELRKYSKNLEVQKSLINELKQSVLLRPEGDYRNIIERLLETHISTKERLNRSGYFYEQLFHSIGLSESIVDVGCGIHPLMFPFDGEGKNIRCYAALEKDTISIDALTVCSTLTRQNVLLPLKWNIKDGWELVLEQCHILRFDTAFFMKLVPVVSRIERNLLHILLDTPAKTWVLTGSKVSMTKYFKIERRERKIIQQFIEESGKKIIGEFSTEDEFVIIVE